MKPGLLVLLYDENTMYKITDDKVIKCTVPLKSKLHVPTSRETRIASRETRLLSRETRPSSRETRVSSRESFKETGSFS